MIFTLFFFCVVVLERVRTIRPRVAFLVNFLHFLDKCCLCPQMAPRPCWGWRCEFDVTRVGCPGEGESQPAPAVLHGLLSSLLAPTLVRLNHKHWDIRLGGSCPWKHNTWPRCPFSFWPFWQRERCYKKLRPARANLGDENLGHPWFMSTARVQGVPTSREHLKWNNRDCIIPTIVNKSKPAGEKSSFASFF